MKIRIFLTFDHELPLGGVKSTYKQALFDPTARVLDLADELGVKITLFTDILAAYRFKEWDTEGFYQPYRNQLHDALKRGHDVQLHIHPHWLTTTYSDGNFSPSTDFALSNFKDRKEFGGISGIIDLSINELISICREVDKNYQCIAYRAGGYNIYPETKLILSSLYNHGIRYDSSIARGYYFKSGISEVDFRQLPNAPNWTINPDNYHEIMPTDQGITEIPIATINKTPFEIPTRFKLKKYAGRAVENRGRMIHEDSRKIGWLPKVRMLFSARMLSFDNHTLSSDYLVKIADKYIKKYGKQTENIMFGVISHPKSMGDYAYSLMSSFIDNMRESYHDVEFYSYTEIHNEH
jgi:hypothetical protein